MRGPKGYARDRRHTQVQHKKAWRTPPEPAYHGAVDGRETDGHWTRLDYDITDRRARQHGALAEKRRVRQEKRLAKQCRPPTITPNPVLNPVTCATALPQEHQMPAVKLDRRARRHLALAEKRRVRRETRASQQFVSPLPSSTVASPEVAVQLTHNAADDVLPTTTAAAATATATAVATAVAVPCESVEELVLHTQEEAPAFVSTPPTSPHAAQPAAAAESSLLPAAESSLLARWTVGWWW